MGVFLTWFAGNGLPIPAVIEQPLEKFSGEANKHLETLEKGAIIYEPTFRGPTNPRRL